MSGRGEVHPIPGAGSAWKPGNLLDGWVQPQRGEGAHTWARLEPQPYVPYRGNLGLTQVGRPVKFGAAAEAYGRQELHQSEDHGDWVNVVGGASDLLAFLAQAGMDSFASVAFYLVFALIDSAPNLAVYGANLLGAL